LALTAAVVIWATTFVVSANALASTSPAVLTMLRFALAAALLVPLALRRGKLRETCRSSVTAVLGLTGVAAYFGLQNLGLLYTTPGTAALLQAVLPVATAALAVVLLGERPTAGTAAGLVFATIGVILVASAGARLDVGAGLIVLGVIAYAVYTVLLRRLGRQPRSTAGTADPVVLAAATALWGLAFLAPWQTWEIATERASLPSGAAAVLATLYLGVVASGVTLLLWTYGASHICASVAGVMTAAIPALGYLCAVLVGEQPTWSKTAGGGLAVTGVVLAARAAISRAARIAQPPRLSDGA
jgi:drug/metabolite transporter (DMT)-like permease